MNQSEKDRVQIALCGVWQTLKPEASPLPLETQRAYLMALEDLGVDQIEQACRIAISKCTWFPKPVELRGMVELSLPNRTQIAWGELQEALDNFGRYDAISFEDVALSSTVRAMGGLIAIAQIPNHEFNSFGWHRFKESYAAFDGARENVVSIEYRTHLARRIGGDKKLHIGGEAGPARIANSPSELAAGLVKKLGSK